MINFDNSYKKLPKLFYSNATPLYAPSPRLLAFNYDLAQELGLDFESLSEDQLANIFTGQTLPEGSACLALAYAGHQFGHRTPMLGDGRALLLGEALAPSGKRYDIQLKGSGRTIYSRNGDGRSSLGPVIREYILSEAMRHLGVPTTRALAACATGERVLREEALPGAIFTRVASSHLRIGSFEYAYNQNDISGLKKLLDYAIERHFPEANDHEDRPLFFLESVAQVQAAMVAKWMSLGFIHGVMNTDNMSISGETLDYGPCAFMDVYASKCVFSSIDRHGRYSYGNQINIAKWNLYKLAGCLVPLIHERSDKAIEILEDSMSSYIQVYEEEWLKQMGLKFGITTPRHSDVKLINTWLNYLEEERLDFTENFRRLGDPRHEFKKTKRYEEFNELWSARGPHDCKAMQQANPAIIPRNHQVEKAIQGALSGDLSHFERMNKALKTPYEENSLYQDLQTPPLPEERVKATFCGT